MQSRIIRTKAVGLSFMLLALLVPAVFNSSVAAQEMPRPQIRFEGHELYEANGKQWVRYKLSVINRAQFSADLFKPAPNLPPCGNNKNSSRAWVDIKNGTKPYTRLYGFCALTSPGELGTLWFAVERGQAPPNPVYIVITDRETGKTAGSGRIHIPKYLDSSPTDKKP